MLKSMPVLRWEMDSLLRIPTGLQPPGLVTGTVGSQSPGFINSTVGFQPPGFVTQFPPFS
jgi:hypothetical protein